MRNMGYVVIFAGFMFLEIVMITLFHSTMLDMVKILVVGNILLMIVSMIYTFDNKVKAIW
jgi:hypothetical protein